MEHRRQPLLTSKTFFQRQLRFLVASLLMGVWGYVHYSPVDAFLNASMILGGMGPVGELPNEGAKWFASFYALYSGIALLGTVAVILTPVVHRMLHALHLDDARI